MSDCCGGKECAKKVSTACIKAEGLDLPEWSELTGKTCVSLSDIINDWYGILCKLSEETDFRSLGNSCMKYEKKDLYHIIEQFQLRLCNHEGHYSRTFYKGCPTCHTSLPVIVNETMVQGYPFIAETQDEADEMAESAVFKYGQSVVNIMSDASVCKAESTEPVWSNPVAVCKDGVSYYRYTNTNRCYNGISTEYREGGNLVCKTPDSCEGKTDTPSYSDTSFGTKCIDGKLNQMYLNTNGCYTGSDTIKYVATEEDCSGGGGTGGGVLGDYCEYISKTDCDKGAEFGVKVNVCSSQMTSYGYSDACVGENEEEANKKAKAYWNTWAKTYINLNGSCVDKSAKLNFRNICSCTIDVAHIIAYDSSNNEVMDFITTIQGNGYSKTEGYDMPVGKYHFGFKNNKVPTCSGGTTEYIFVPSEVELKEGTTTVVDIKCDSYGGQTEDSSCGTNRTCNLTIEVKDDSDDDNALTIEIVDGSTVVSTKNVNYGDIVTFNGLPVKAYSMIVTEREDKIFSSKVKYKTRYENLCMNPCDSNGVCSSNLYIVYPKTHVINGKNCKAYVGNIDGSPESGNGTPVGGDMCLIKVVFKNANNPNLTNIAERHLNTPVSELTKAYFNILVYFVNNSGRKVDVKGLSGTYKIANFPSVLTSEEVVDLSSLRYEAHFEMRRFITNGRLSDEVYDVNPKFNHVQCKPSETVDDITNVVTIEL